MASSAQISLDMGVVHALMDTYDTGGWAPPFQVMQDLMKAGAWVDDTGSGTSASDDFSAGLVTGQNGLDQSLCDAYQVLSAAYQVALAREAAEAQAAADAVSGKSGKSSAKSSGSK